MSKKYGGRQHEETHRNKHNKTTNETATMKKMEATQTMNIHANRENTTSQSHCKNT